MVFADGAMYELGSVLFSDNVSHFLSAHRRGCLHMLAVSFTVSLTQGTAVTLWLEILKNPNEMSAKTLPGLSERMPTSVSTLHAFSKQNPRNLH